MGNFVIFFGIFEESLSQDGVISLGNSYKFSWFSLPATGKTLDFSRTAQLAAVPTQYVM